MRILKISAAYLVLLVCLAAVQICIDRGGRRGKKAAVPQLVTVTEYNVCITGAINIATLLDLPLAYKSSAITPKPSEDSCPFNASKSEDLGRRKHSTMCEKLFAAEELTEEEEGWIAEINSLKKGDDVDLLRKTMDCNWVRQEMANGFFVSDEEKGFPIAYAINLNQYPRQVLRFLRTIYRPHNIYCLHYDVKSDSTTKQIMFNVASCLGNVVISRKTEDVYWGWYTLEEAYFNCFSELMLARDTYPWRYVITLCGKELPLRTNAEIVALLEPLNGTSSVQAVEADGTDDFKFKWKWSLNKMRGWITMKDEPLPPIPYGLKVYKSWAYVALSYQFVEHLLCSPVAIALREYMKDVLIPEENFYIMLFMHPGTPGGFRPEHEKDIFPIIGCIWLDKKHVGWKRSVLFPHTVCAGKKVHSICMLGAKDLHNISYRPGIPELQSNAPAGNEPKIGHELADRGPLFHNRYMMGYDSVVMECTEQELARRNKLEHAKMCVSPVVAG